MDLHNYTLWRAVQATYNDRNLLNLAGGGMMERPWLKQYPAGVASEVDTSACPTLASLLEDSFSRFPGRTAFVCMDQPLSYAELDRASRALGAWLQARGLQPGERIAVMLPNLLQYPIAAAAILRIGCVVVNVNPLYSARELQYQLQDCGARAIVILENFAATLERVLPETDVEHVVVASIGEMFKFPKDALVNFLLRHVRKMVPHWHLPGHVKFNQAVVQGGSMALSAPSIQPSDLAVLQYTGGTTGRSKGAMLRHSALVAAVLSTDEWCKPAQERIKSEQYNVVCALPLYHCFAFVSCMLCSMRFGSCSFLIPNPRDLGATIKALRGHKLHVFPGVNTLFNALLNHPEFSSLDFSELTVTTSGGMAAQSSVARRWLEATGCPMAEAYGMSEFSCGATCNRLDLSDFTGTVGIPMPGVDACVLDEDGVRLPAGEAGEVALRGTQMMAGYWNKPEESALVMTADGWMRTGDIGAMDASGYLRILDRKKDLINVSGFKVYPSEVEEVVSAHPGVLECAAIGVADERSGEALVLYVVRKDPALDEAALRDYCADQLTAYKRPREVVFSKSLPKSNVGKILRRELREERVQCCLSSIEANK